MFTAVGEGGYLSINGTDTCTDTCSNFLGNLRFLAGFDPRFPLQTNSTFGRRPRNGAVQPEFLYQHE